MTSQAAAFAALNLDELSGGRFTFGIGFLLRQQGYAEVTCLQLQDGSERNHDGQLQMLSLVCNGA